MKKPNELKFTELKNQCKPSTLPFNTTEELSNLEGVIGQKRGIDALEFGIAIDVKGYNIYIEGPTGVGKTMYAKKYIDKIASKKKTPPDWCYIYNFNNPNNPIAISLPAGQGRIFKTDMEEFIQDIKRDIKDTFSNDDFEKERALIRQDFENKKSKLMENLNNIAKQQGFEVKTANNGIYLMPLVDGKAVDETEFNKLDAKVQQEFEQKSTVIQAQVIEIMNKIKNIEKSSDKKIEEWQQNLSLLTINIHINSLKTKYKKNKKITQFLKDIQADILKNLSDFISDDSDNKKAAVIPNTLPNQPWLRYRVNLFVDNSETNGCPVIMDSNTSYFNIFGKLEYENQFGTLKTDYTMLKPGILHNANGGYAIFQVKDLLSNKIIWDQFKKSLLIKELNIDGIKDQAAAVAMVSLKPEPIPLKIKVVLLGTSQIYQTLLAYDEDFRKLFKIKSEFEESAPRNDENILMTSQFIHYFCERESFPHLDNEAMSKVIEYSSRVTDDKFKITTQFSELTEIVGEACTFAKLDKAKLVTKDYIIKALNERINRVNKYDRKYSEMIEDGTLLIDTTGSKVGQINGLSILRVGDYTFGKPTKITASTYMGKDGIINIEREVKLSGTSHSKGIFILTGYLGQKFAQDMPLCLTASICFEQLYNGVDGDSASSTELYALLSSLSNIPINQSIAVTGSVNQKGEIQPIGGVNEKIEGFYQICKLKELTGEQGVIIPKQNIKNLNLSDEVIEAVKKGLFHIYAISTIDEGIEILTGVPAGKQDKLGSYPAGTINYLVYEKLKDYAKKSKNRN